jgi:hypothetical protein
MFIKAFSDLGPQSVLSPSEFLDVSHLWHAGSC